MMRELAIKANEQIQRIKDWYAANSSAFDYMNLKLHDVSYYCYSKMKEDFPLCYANDNDGEYSYFYRFCEDQYDMFVEDLKENFGIDFEKNHHFYLGRTSSFYLHNQDIFQFERFRINWFWTMNKILSEIYVTYYGNYTEFHTDGTVDLDSSIKYIEENYTDKEGAYENLKNELEWLATKMYDDVVTYFKDMLVVYEYIKDFKENQVETFKDWIQYYEDEYTEEKRKEEEYEAARQSLIARFDNPVLREILSKYVSSNEAIERLLLTV